MYKKLFTDYRLIVAGAALLLLAYTGYAFISMERAKGLRIHAPGQQPVAASAGFGNSSANLQSLQKINPHAFSSAFALDFNRQPAVPVVKEPVKNPEPVKVVEEKIEPAVKTVDLSAAGYKLKGIIHDELGNSVIFVYDPEERRTVVIREQQEGKIKVLQVEQRSVILSTPEGEGKLELEDARGIKQGAASAFSAPGAKLSQKAAARQFKAARLLEKNETSAAVIADMINAGHFQVRQNRGKFDVNVKKIPQAFSGYGLRPGDKIVGTSQKDFKRSQDVAHELGKVSERPTPLKVRRGRKIIFLNPPAKRE